VFAGEIIEHLDCVRGLFETARVHLRPGGSFVITTPNAFAFPNFVYRLGGSVRVNSDHTCWYCEDTLAQLIRREEFVVDDITYLKYRSHGRARGLAADLIRRLLPDRLAWSTLIAVCHPA
jgi:2-polyprenyl-3-methyl-5-hydroxy-6-metoxy-1,4-benzoquinol methylase